VNRKERRAAARQGIAAFSAGASDRIAALFAAALPHHRAGRLTEAEAIYRQILAADPEHLGSLHLLGAIAHQTGRNDAAADLLAKAIALNDRIPELHVLIAAALGALGRHDEAVAHCACAVRLAPDNPEAHHNLGTAGVGLGRFAEAELSFRAALRLRPSYAKAQYNLGIVLEKLGRPAEAEACYREAVRLQPDYAEAFNNLGNVLKENGRLDEATSCCREALRLRPDLAEAHSNLGNALREIGRFREAEACYREAIRAKPGLPEAHGNLGGVLNDLGYPTQAEICCRAALRLKPDFPAAHVNLGNALKDLGCLKEAAGCYREAMRIDPSCVEAHTNLIFVMNFDADVTLAEQQRERTRWFDVHGRRLAVAADHANEPDPDRRLRVGYVSAHFRHQAATYAFAPVVLGHDPERFEVFCYSDTTAEDELTQKFRAGVHSWRNTVGASDEKLAALMRADRIDILVDTVGFMSGHRLLAFARKPAPIQATGWGEPTGTGVPAMDYLLADPVFVPNSARRLLTEQVIDLPCVLAYWTPHELPEPSPLPALANGYVTFGSFNRLTKITDLVLECWAAILRRIPNARLVLKDRMLDDPGQARRISSFLGHRGVADDRLAMLGRSTRSDHFAAYRGIDIALDPFPHGGGMTTLDAAWMGVPAITCPGETMSSRLAAASLTVLGLVDFIAADRSACIDVAVAKASDLTGLSALRHSLRARMMQTPIGDSAAYTRAVESAYRAVWRRWCETRLSAAER